MNIRQSDFDARADESAAGQCTIVAALVIALHENGVLEKDKYIAAVQRLWIDMPEEVAIGEAGAVVERVLELLEAHTGSFQQSHVTEQRCGQPVLAHRVETERAYPEFGKDFWHSDTAGEIQELSAPVETH